MTRPPDAFLQTVQSAAWPLSSLTGALSEVAHRYGLTGGGLAEPLMAVPTLEELPSWIEVQASRLGLQADQTFASLRELETLLRHGAPLILRLAALGDHSFLLVIGCQRRSIRVWTPDGMVRTLSISAVARLIRTPFEQPLIPSIDLLLDRMALKGRRRTVARRALVRDRLTSLRFRGCWLLRLPPGSELKHEIGDARFVTRVASLIAAYAGQYACFVGSWWLLGQAMVSDSASQGWLLGWLLLLISLIPLRLVVTWEQGLLTITVGTWLRRRLLRGAFRVDRQYLRRKGVGELFTAVVEAAALDAMALSGGLAAAFAVLEIGGACIVLWFGASRWPIPILAVWTAFAGITAWLYFRGRRDWTARRFSMAHELLEAMMGHRTRLAQQPPDQQHTREDETLEGALTLGDRMDRLGVLLVALVPRGWLVIALISLVPAVARGASPSALAISLGGLLLTYRALQRLAAGLTHLTAAVLAAQSTRTLAVAASASREPSVVPQSLSKRVPDSRREPVLQARDLVFRYRAQGEPVIAGATLSIERGGRYLLEGPSGSGKTTFAAMLAGIERPESGLVSSNGLDRASLGDVGWRSRVVMAPQPHDNYLVGASLAFNLLMGRRWPAEPDDLAEANAICRELGLGELLDRLPAGLDQVVGETGWQLSQGERVRVFLARALLQQPDVLVLDESFVALDPENVDRALRTVANSGRAVLAIAHT